MKLIVNYFTRSAVKTVLLHKLLNIFPHSFDVVCSMCDVRRSGQAVFLLCCLVFFSGSSLLAEEKGLLFYASFDKGVDADFAKGCPDASGCAEITENRQGYSGEALIAKYGWYGVEQYTGIKYLTAGNLKHSQGTIEFYLKPLPGFFQQKKQWRRIFVSMYNKVFENNRRLYRWFRIDFTKKKTRLSFRVFEQDQHTGHQSHIQKHSPDFKENIWYKIAYCWQGKNRSLFINGKLVASGQATGTLPQAGSQLFIGSGPHGGEASNCLIDELKIWDHVKYKKGKN